MIIKVKVDVIVNVVNECFDNCGGVVEVIVNVVGSEMEMECRFKMGKWFKIKVLENIVICVGKLFCCWIIYVVGFCWSNYSDKEEVL